MNVSQNDSKSSVLSDQSALWAKLKVNFTKHTKFEPNFFELVFSIMYCGQVFMKLPTTFGIIEPLKYSVSPVLNLLSQVTNVNSPILSLNMFKVIDTKVLS